MNTIVEVLKKGKNTIVEVSMTLYYSSNNSLI